MFEFQKRANTTNYIKLDRNNYIPQKPQRFRDIYINQSPTFYNQYRYDTNNPIPNMPSVQYVYKQKRPFEYYSNDRYENFSNSLKNLNSDNDYFFNEFNYKKNNHQKERSFVQRSVNTMTSPNPRKINEIYYLEKNKKMIDNSQDNKNRNVRKFYKPFEYENQDEEKREKKLFIKNPILNSNDEEKMKMDNYRNTVNTIAQKICNIVIQGEGKKDKKKKNKNKSEKSSANKNMNPRIDLNKIESKNLNLNNNNNDDENYNREYNEENENEEIEGNVNNENENYFIRKESNEEYEEEENMDNINNNEYEYPDKNKMTKEKDEQYEVELNEQEEQNEENENYENEDEQEYQEIEEDEKFQEIHRDNNENKSKKNICYEIQKKNEIELNPKKNIIKKEQLNIIKDNNIEILGLKKQKILEINSESNIELLNKKQKPLIEIQKVQNYEQPRDFQRRSNKKKQLKITKNEENNVDIIQEYNQTEPIYQIEKTQNFKQQRTKERNSERKRNKMKKYKISKLKDANIFIEKKELTEPILFIEKVHDFSNINQRNIINKAKNIDEYKIDNIVETNFILEKISKEPKMMIQKVNNYFQMRNKERKIKSRKNKYKLKIEKQKGSYIEIIKKPSISINKQENIEIKGKNIIKKKKNDNKNLKKSIRNTLQYQAKQMKQKPNIISISKPTKFSLKGRAKKPIKKPKNLIKQEIIFFYKSPLITKKIELSISDKIENVINPIAKNDKEKIKLKTISPQNSFHYKSETENNHIIGVSPEKEGKNKEYNSNTFPINSIQNEQSKNNLKAKLDNENKNINSLENKKEIIEISQIRGDKKPNGKKYISPRRLRKSYEGQSDDNKNNDNNRTSLNSVNTFDLKQEEKNEKNESKGNNNIYYSSSFRQSKKDNNKRLENNALFISARSSSSSKNDKNSDSKKEVNMNRILINSSNNSPIVLKNLENSRIKIESNDINKISLSKEIDEIKKDKEKKEENSNQKENKQDIFNNDNNEVLPQNSPKIKESKINTFNFLDNLNNLDSQELSEYTQAYLNSYISSSRPELSDFSKQFLSSNVTNNDYETKPELSNITRAYLFSQNSDNEEK